MWCCMSAQYQGVGAGEGLPPPTQSAKLKVIYGLKITDLDSFYKGRSFYMTVHVYCVYE